MNLIGKNVLLRAMEINDMPKFQEMTNNPELEVMIGGWSFPVSSNNQRNWYESKLNDNENLRLSIVDRTTEALYGMLNLVDIDWKNGTAFHGIRLLPETPKKQGIATDAVMSVMKYAFEELRLNRLDGSIVENNIASKKLYEKCGWQNEGVLRKHVFKNGSYYDVIMVGILKEEYYEVKKKLEY